MSNSLKILPWGTFVRSTAILRRISGGTLKLIVFLASLTWGLETLAATTNMNPKVVIVCFVNDHGEILPAAQTNKVVKPDAEWRKLLTPEQYQIARGKGTERAFCGIFHDHKKPGLYSCICCDLPLFSASAKFDSGTGWPSFFAPVAKENVVSHTDNSFGMRRVEILCARCDAHLGHVFDDGPKPTGLRYCLNSASMVFKEKKSPQK